ncbi:hypothetical protein ACRRTK_000323 [Alexandromys fortis]
MEDPRAGSGRSHSPGCEGALEPFIEEPGRRTWSSMCILCKGSDGRLNQLTRTVLRFRPAGMQMRRHRNQWCAQGRAQRARSRFPLCDSRGDPAAAAARQGQAAPGGCGAGLAHRVTDRERNGRAGGRGGAVSGAAPGGGENRDDRLT